MKKIMSEIAKELEGGNLKGKDPLAVLLGRRGGLKGGKARAEKLTPERRKEIAQRGAQARWAKDNPTE
jgi:hypothetical protein